MLIQVAFGSFSRPIAAFSASYCISPSLGSSAQAADSPHDHDRVTTPTTGFRRSILRCTDAELQYDKYSNTSCVMLSL
ncbi:hypothetical protein C8Q73DRAFT_306269 [Cubamyces lactineus]|nr:hypothetical protein C8Q73DRAFT_306269 [Cubamyces lactineus]